MDSTAAPDHRTKDVQVTNNKIYPQYDQNKCLKAIAENAWRIAQDPSLTPEWRDYFASIAKVARDLEDPE